MLTKMQWISGFIIGASIGLSISGAFHWNRLNATPEGYTEDTVEYCIQILEDLKEQETNTLW